MYYNIQTLRGISALLVLLFHLLPHFKDMGLESVIYESTAKYGYIGVDIFFVISGLVMAKAIAYEQQSFKSSISFLSKRFFRIYLGYWPVFLLTLIYYYIYLPEFLAGKKIFQSFFLININMTEIVVGTAWSLTYELYFYVIIAGILVWDKINQKVVLTSLAVFVTLNIVTSIFIGPNALNFVLSHFVLEFLAGFYLYNQLDKIQNKKYLLAISIIGVMAFILGINIKIENDYTRVITFGVFGVALVWLLMFLEHNKFLIIRGFLKRLGDASYSLYLLHVIFVQMFYSSGLRGWLVLNNIAVIGFVLYIIFIVMFSMYFYKFVELPLYKTARKRYIIPQG